VSVTVKNAGSRPGDEVVQLYLADLEASCRVPRHSLRGFARVHLLPGEARRVSFELSPRDLSLIDERGRRVLEPGRFRVSVGGSQPDARSQELTGQSPLSVEFDLLGQTVELPY
jgi:beta-glucosidase